MTTESPLAPQLSTDLTPAEAAAWFLSLLPWPALPGPPRLLALPASMPVSAGLARVTAPVSFQAPAPRPTPAPAPAPDDDFPAPPPLTPPSFMSAASTVAAATNAPTPISTAPPQEELEPSPWDPGFDPPKSAVGTDPSDPGPDPRLLSRNRPRRTTRNNMAAVSTVPRPLPVIPANAAAAANAPKRPGPPETPTHDIIIVPQNPTFKTAEPGVNAVITYLRTAQFFGYRARKEVDGEMIFELGPEAFVHQVFADGQAPEGPPSALEATLRASTTPLPLAFGPPGRLACFSLALVGCRFPKVADGFKARLHQILYLRPEVFAVPHDPTRLRAPAAPIKPLPSIDVVELDRG